jgi:hypothetical protein
MALCGILTPLWPALPLVALCYLAVHTNLVVANRLAHAVKHQEREKTHD